MATVLVLLLLATVSGAPLAPREHSPGDLHVGGTSAWDHGRSASMPAGQPAGDDDATLKRKRAAAANKQAPAGVKRHQKDGARHSGAAEQSRRVQKNHEDVPHLDTDDHPGPTARAEQPVVA